MARGYSGGHSFPVRSAVSRNFQGHFIESDVLMFNLNGTVSSYYVEKEDFTETTGFFQRKIFSMTTIIYKEHV